MYLYITKQGSSSISCQRVIFLKIGSQLLFSFELDLNNRCFVVPGQFVALEAMPDDISGSSQERHSGYYALASSPYAVHRESADLDASIIEVAHLIDTASHASNC